MGKNENKVMLDVFIPNNYGDQSKEDFMTICEKGFTEVLQFQYGQIDLRKTPKEADDYYEIMFCKVAIGTTYIFPAKDENDLVPRKEKPDKMTD